MHNQPIKYQVEPEGKWYPYPLNIFPMSQEIIDQVLPSLLSGPNHTVPVSGIWPGSYILIYALKWGDGAQWTCVDGVISGEFPR